MSKIAALFVETNGVYYGLDNIEPWDKQRDARKYKGPYPVIAHHNISNSTTLKKHKK